MTRTVIKTVVPETAATFYVFIWDKNSIERFPVIAWLIEVEEQQLESGQYIEHRQLVFTRPLLGGLWTADPLYESQSPGLIEYTRNGEPYMWVTDEERAFADMKEAISSALEYHETTHKRKGEAKRSPTGEQL